MKLDRHRSKDCTQAAIVREEIHPLRGASKVSHVDQNLAAHRKAHTFLNQSVLGEVVHVRVKDVFLDALRDLVEFGVRRAPGVNGCKAGENFTLQASIKLHPPGLRDRRFEWDQNDSTSDEPGTAAVEKIPHAESFSSCGSDSLNPIKSFPDEAIPSFSRQFSKSSKRDTRYPLLGKWFQSSAHARITTRPIGGFSLALTSTACNFGDRDMRAQASIPPARPG